MFYRAVGAGPAGAAAARPKFGVPTKEKMAVANSLSTNLAKLLDLVSEKPAKRYTDNFST